jgi:hypothetical protein
MKGHDGAVGTGTPTSCESGRLTSGSLALVDVASLNHRLHQNINSARNYESPINLLIGRAAQ